jgi:hypothetical protein
MPLLNCDLLFEANHLMRMGSADRAAAQPIRAAMT